MAITIAQAQTHLDSARSFLANNNAESARAEVQAALAVIAGLPEGEKSGARFTLSQMRQAIDILLPEINRQIREDRMNSLGKAGIQRTRIKYKTYGKASDI